MKRFILHKDSGAVGMSIRQNCMAHINTLSLKRSWVVEIKEYRKKRSLDQNAYLHAVPMKLISEFTGHDKDDLRTYLCGEFTGWTEYEMFGRKKVKPVKTTSDMDTKEMTDFIEWLQWWAMETLDLRIPSPNEWEGEY